MLSYFSISNRMHDGAVIQLLFAGVVITDMTKQAGSNATVTPEESVSGIMERLQTLNMSSTGTFWDYRGGVIPW